MTIAVPEFGLFFITHSSSENAWLAAKLWEWRHEMRNSPRAHNFLSLRKNCHTFFVSITRTTSLAFACTFSSSCKAIIKHLCVILFTIAVLLAGGKTFPGRWEKCRAISPRVPAIFSRVAFLAFFSTSRNRSVWKLFKCAKSAVEMAPAFWPLTRQKCQYF